MKFLIVILGFVVVSCNVKNKTIATLDGSKSHDSNKGGKIINYKWRQIRGQAAKIYSSSAVKTKVELPDTGTYSFEIWGINHAGFTNKDTTTIKVIE